MAEQRVQRRLAAILAADVVGYSRLTRADESGTRVRYNAHLKDLIEPRIAEHQGRIVKSSGDGFLVEFSSVVDAVQCAADIQRAMPGRNAGVPGEQRIEFRIGVNLGDVIVEDDDIHGDGVNVASRLEGLAEPNGVCISGSVFEQVKDRMTVGFEDLGPQQVKNIPEPINAYRVLFDPVQAGQVIVGGAKRKRWLWPAVAASLLVLVGGGTAWWQPWVTRVEAASVERMAFPLPERPSIAVLPFVNLSGDKEQEYFADGVSEDIVTDLAKVSGLFVVDHNSTITYKGKAVKARQIAEDLGVRYVLRGSIRRSADSLRINVQLIDAVKGNHVWAERYDREVKDVFAIQDEIAVKVAAELAVTLKADEQERLFRPYTDSLEAYDTFLRATRLGGGGANRQAKRKRLVEQVIKLDPDFAGGYALLSMIHAGRVRRGHSASPKEDIERALALARKAIATDDTFGMSYAALGGVYLYKHEQDKAVAAIQEAVRLHPNKASPRALLGYFLHWAGRAEEAIDALKTAIRLDPKPAKYRSSRNLRFLGWAYFTAERYEDAIAALQQTYANSVRRGGDSLGALAAAYAATGQNEKARAVIKAFLDKKPGLTISSYRSPRLYKRREDRDRFVNLLRKAGMPERTPLELPDKPSIAVLPFTNMSEDKAQGFFSDGITEDIITDLSKVSGLFVIARNSTFQYKGKSVDVRKVARDLGVRHVLEGSVRRSADKLRITVQLVDATTGGHIWGERYDRTPKDVFAIQDEIAAKVVGELAVTLKAHEQERLYRRHTDNLEAYETYLQAWRMRSPTRDVNRLAKRKKLLERVVELDPNFAGGYALRSFNLGSEIRQGLSASRKKDIERALKLARKAVATDETFAFSYLALGSAYLVNKEHDKAVAAAREAVRIQPNFAAGHAVLGYYLNWAGSAEEGIEALKTAQRLDPKPTKAASFRNRVFLGMTYFTAGRYDDAIETMIPQYALQVRRGGNSLCFLAAAYVATGQIEKARAPLKAFLAKRPTTTLANYSRIRLYKRAEDRDRFANLLRKAGMPE
jgi:adenylate cyclase